MKIFILIIFILILSLVLFINTAQFGAFVCGEPFKNLYPIEFENIDHNNRINVIRAVNAMLKNQKEKVKIPSQKTDLKNLDPKDNVLIWFGHSSYFIQIEGKRFLVDPVFSKVASPIPGFPKAFSGADIYKSSDMPEIDYLIITHDHFDHLDFHTVRSIKFKQAICPLKVGKHLRRWKVQNITEMNWVEESLLGRDFRLFCLPAQHFSGRGFLRNRTLWASFLLQSPDGFKIFIGGDGGYGSHFSDIGKRFQEIDLAILENGQYSEYWPKIHMSPEETVEAAKNLNAKFLFPVHNSKFSLAPHKWNEPLTKISKLALKQAFKLITPMIGEKVNINNLNQKFQDWWTK